MELSWRWWEEIKHSYRALLREMGTDSITPADLKFYALAPGPDGQARFRFPGTWDLDEPSGYFQLVVLPRKQRRLTRTMWNLVHKAPRAPKKKAVVVEEPIHKEPEPPEPEKTPEKPKKTRAPRPKTEAVAAPPTPTEAREPDPPSPRTTLRDAAHHIQQLQSLRTRARRTHLADAYTRNLR